MVNFDDVDITNYEYHNNQTTYLFGIENANAGQAPSEKYGMALIIPIFVGIIVFAGMISAMVFYYSYLQEKRSRKQRQGVWSL